ncbi:MAG: hypothetical protein JXM70_24190 [Pirellulales bacterium]|nr:hypothetical protein [Pirellulales bacterium]
MKYEMTEAMLFINKICFVSVFYISLAFSASSLMAETSNPVSPDYTGRKGSVIYVSKLGDNSNGSSWQKAFHTIQAALLAVPDDQGGHRIVVRPDRYVEARLYPIHKGARGAYNALIGDTDGSMGSGATGRVIIDSSCPGVAVRRDESSKHQYKVYQIIKSDLPESGLKSIDYWGSILVGPASDKAGNPTNMKFSSISWDRWALKNLYTSGSDAGFFWDIDIIGGEPAGNGFTVIVEDCVSIGRAFGGGVCYPKVRPEEPCVFRRSYFLSLDWIGDSCGVLIGGCEKEMPKHPHLIMEDCTLFHTDNALAMSFASRCARVKMNDCRLVVLMFTQKEMGGDKTATGVISTYRHRPEGRLHVDLEDCILAGYSVFTPNVDPKTISYTTKGKVQAYVHYRQPTPKGFERLGLWPAELFDRIAPPRPQRN